MLSAENASVESTSAPATTEQKKTGTTENALKILDQIIELFRSENSSKLVDLASRALLVSKSGNKPSDNWTSFANYLIMLSNNTTDARTYLQWRDVKRNVKKGAKAFYILAPIEITVPKDKKNKVTGVSEGTERIKIIRGFRAVPEFRYEDTEGEPLPEEKEVTPRKLPMLLEVAKQWDVTVKYGFCGNAYGYYQHGTNTIKLNTEDETVFFHELGHKADHLIRNEKGEKMKGGQDAEQEAIAELTAVTLGKMYGHDIAGSSWQYIAHYAENKTPEAVGRLCVKVLARVREVIELILTTAEKLNAGQTVPAPAATIAQEVAA